MSPRDGAAELRAIIDEAPEMAVRDLWPEPDMEVLRLHRRPPPKLPIEVFGDAWGPWIIATAEAAACPMDYVAVPLLACVSALIGHARWAQATPGWAEPPHLWLGAVGDSGNGKSPGADCLMRDVLPVIERTMLGDFPDRRRRWRATVEFEKAAAERWQQEVRQAEKTGTPAPLPPIGTAGPEPQAPRLRQNDVTIEKVAHLLAATAPKGLLIVRDELAGWIAGMNAYNDAGRAFWIEAYGGRPYRIERVKHPEPIIIPRLAVAAYGGTQPDKLALLMREADDGLLARVLWTWPEPIPFRLSNQAPGVEWAICALDRLRELDLQPGDPPSPIMVPLNGPPADVPPSRWQRFVDDVGLFLDRWADYAAALGWTPYDLFGCDRDRPFSRMDRAGLLWLLNGDRLVMLAEDAATIETRTGARQTWRRKPREPGRVLVWELVL